MRATKPLLIACILAAAFPLTVAAQDANDWLTWGHDQERSGWNRSETSLTKANVSRLAVQWSTQLATPPTDIALSTLTAPLVVEGVPTAAGIRNMVFLLAADDTLFAV